MSIRVMVVDDEPIAAQGTRVMIEKVDPDLEVVALCHSGREAVSKADLLHPDIVIMDIQMPGINGLEAMRRIREGNPHASFIVLSAYSEFSYAVEALTLGACDYLLKPVKQVNFTASLQKVVADTLARKVDMDLELQQQERLQIAIPMIRRDFIRSLLPGAGADERLVACASFLGISEQPGFVLTIAPRQGTVPHPLDGVVDSLSLQAGLIADIVRPDLAVAYLPVPAGGGSPTEEMERWLGALLRRQRGGEDVVAGIGGVFFGAISAKASLRQALAALEYMRGAGGEERRCALFDSGFMELPEEEHWEGPRDDAPSTTKKIIEKATALIEENYHRELSLDEVASHVNLSHYYFSRLFKEHTGTNFSELLLQVRISKAKELLADPDSSIKDVAYRVGFNDPNYFSKVFRKATGIKASDYRAIHEKTSGTEEG